MFIKIWEGMVTRFSIITCHASFWCADVADFFIDRNNSGHPMDQSKKHSVVQESASKLNHLVYRCTTRKCTVTRCT